MPERRLSSLDRLLAAFDNALKSIAAPATGSRPYPAAGIRDGDLDAAERSHAAGLMRVNHAGEIAAQALYQGHAAVARDAATERHLQRAAAEEFDHLAWCEQRLRELGAKPSLLAPVWYGGAFVIGALSGAFGDRWSLGFIAETEQQVCAHLDRHLAALPDADERSRAIVSKMRDEESVHGADARRAGAHELPAPVQRLMALTARVMTGTAYRL